MRYNVKNLSDGELVQLRDAAISEYNERVSYINTRRAALAGQIKEGNGSHVTTGLFRNPENPAQTWTGKGRRPFWYVKAVKRGAKPEALRS
jgi:DNA-binding protein H-NS